ncbi:hypothetical protein WMW71_12955 [Flavobacterium buctense]|uniref:DUF2490 domain-containing protein n=1 Tax=Flavobacterium buctense TaxID=1648146 RepID=A0ABU9E5J6_9FLAO|nr:hypothetical protein [Flavobacterium buctense]
MRRIKTYKLILSIQLLIGYQIGFSQVMKDSLKIDSVDAYNTKWMTIGSQYDCSSSTFGLVLSNGYDESPLIHFEDFSEDLIFKIQGNTNFERNHSIETDFGWKYPIKHISAISIGFYQYDYWQRHFFHRDLNLSAETYIRKLDVSLKLKIAYQTLNDYENLGTDLEIRKVILYQKLYSGLAVGYYFDYFKYSAYIHGFVYRNKIGLRLSYEKIDTYDFLNVGLNYTFIR